MLAQLIELRQRLIKVIILFFTVFLLFLWRSSTLFHYLISPLTHELPSHLHLVATQITTPAVTPFVIALDFSLLATMPYILFHLWKFIAPGLYPHERKNLRFTIVFSIFLFILGAVFCFYIVLPLILKFLVNAIPNDVQLMPEMSMTIHFITHMIILFGCCFQIPLISVLLVKTNLIKLETLKQIRPYWIVIAFILGMIFTPPDVLSQIALAIPLCLLYELGLFFIKII